MTAADTTALATPQTASARPSWERIGDFLVLLAYSCTVLFTVRYHEKWGDEAQAWLIARDLPLSRIWFYELRYEGSPGLWHTILWLAQHWFHATYGALGYIGVAFAVAGMAVLIFKAPFPWYLRWPMAFTYFFVYQYAVIARTYTLLPLLCFLVAIFFIDVNHPERMTVALVLLANLSLHGAMLAGCFGLLYSIEALQSWRSLGDRLRNRYFLCAGVMVLTFVFLFILLKPTPDVEEFLEKRQIAQLSDEIKQQYQFPSPLKKAANIIPGAFLDYLLPSIGFLTLTAAWFFTRKRLLLFVLPVGLMIGLYSLIHGAPHHHGTAFVAAITALWIAWPSTEQLHALTRFDTWAMRGMVGLLLLLCLVNVWDSAVVIRREYLYPYSGAKDASEYLKSVGAIGQPMFGLLWGVVGIQAYFDHNIFANVATAYFHHGLPLYGRSLDLDELEHVKPEYMVVYTQDAQLTADNVVPQFAGYGYEMVHFSDGYYLYKRAVANREVYFIFRRVHPNPAGGN